MGLCIGRLDGTTFNFDEEVVAVAVLEKNKTSYSIFIPMDLF